MSAFIDMAYIKLKIETLLLIDHAHFLQVNKGSTTNKTFYFLKDIQFLMHEPIINKFREYKVRSFILYHTVYSRMTFLQNEKLTV